MQIATEFIIDYLGNVGSYSVTTNNKPGFLCKVLPKQMPQNPEAFSTILADMYEHVLPGMAHWLHPQFHGYFPTGSSYPDILAETIISALGIVTFSWDSTPSITELEVVMVNWMAKAMGLSEKFCFGTNPSESEGGGAMQAHTCIEKACNLALVRLRLVHSDADDFAMHGKALECEIKKDHERGLIPFLIHATSGTTSVASFDRLRELSDLAKRYNAWLHVDAAYAGAALICPEFRYLMDGINEADSLNMNPHKMLLSSVTCSLLWTKHQRVIRETFEAEPLYLKRAHTDAMDFRHWGVSLNRRAKALKLWFLLRMYAKIRFGDVRFLYRADKEWTISPCATVSDTQFYNGANFQVVRPNWCSAKLCI